ncbi:MAG: alpha-glucan family phosphorylase [Myxococcales bacterium]|nr:alpha-glucan family phosphorylase [Myxococcales bacterium]
MQSTDRRIAYFSMEIGLDPALPTYSGGLGILAGDTLKAAADLGVPIVAVSLLYREGYFRQTLDAQGSQSESPYVWKPEQSLEALKPRVVVTIEGRRVELMAWRYVLRGVTGAEVPVLFLDAGLPSNAEWDRALTSRLYAGDEYVRLCQEAILGLGGVEMLRALGYQSLAAFHMNEGHSALLTLALLAEAVGDAKMSDATPEHVERVRRSCVFTTHTPVPAGHDQFPLPLVRQVLGDEMADTLQKGSACLDGTLNMTYLALQYSHYVNGVAMRHGDVSQDMFPKYPIRSITNGVHAATWVSPPFQRLFDQHIPDWRMDNHYLRYAVGIRRTEILAAHEEAKASLFDEITARTGRKLDPRVLTIGFARRAAAYKRADLLFTDLDRLKWISRNRGRVQVIYAGKAHPRDESGKALIRRVFEAAKELKEYVDVLYLADYDMTLGKLLCAGVDVWLNTPLKPHEASGTSGMKAALNGVPSFSILDGWWIEGHLEGVTGWSIGEEWYEQSDGRVEAASIYHKLESTIIPLFYRQPDEYARVMRSAISINGSFFNTERMIIQYVNNAYASALRHDYGTATPSD